MLDYWRSAPEVRPGACGAGGPVAQVAVRVSGLVVHWLPEYAGAARLRALVRRARVLLAEDNVVNQRVAIGILEKAGHTMTLAENGLIALNKFDREPFDLILMDGEDFDGGQVDRRHSASFL